MNGFTPDIGNLIRYRVPSGEHIRVDDAYLEGMDIPIYYDPMIAKLIVWGSTREEAIERMISAIDDYQISGLHTTLDFGKYVLKHEAFRSGNFDTNFVKHYFEDPGVMHEAMQEEQEALQHGINTVWCSLKERDMEEFASREILSSWKQSRS
jgi:propionyl-CoA carboxylase alpha chain